MKLKYYFLIYSSIFSFFLLLSGCASTGVVPMGRDTYMISGSQPAITSFSNSGALKARLLKQANDWCKNNSLVMVPLNYNGFDGPSVNAEIIFRAVPFNDLENTRPNFERAPDHHQMISIQDSGRP